MQLPSLFLNQSKDLLWDVMLLTNKELLAAEHRSILSCCADVRLCVSFTVIITGGGGGGKGKVLPVQAPRFRFGTQRW